jgi:hypothetical protein
MHGSISLAGTFYSDFKKHIFFGGGVTYVPTYITMLLLET